MIQINKKENFKYKEREIIFPTLEPPFTQEDLFTVEQMFKIELQEREEAARIAKMEKEHRDAIWIVGFVLLAVLFLALLG